MKMSLKQQPFGTMPDGRIVHLFRLENSQGMRVSLINYGAALVGIEVPDQTGLLADVVLGFDDLSGYLSAENPYFGACCGRYANRIAKGRFVLDGEAFQLPQNLQGNCLHGGTTGFDKKYWMAEEVDGGVKMSLESADGEMGFPGNLRVEVLYTLTAENVLRLEYSATTDRKTVINLTNHAYFNLAGSGSVREHLVEIFTDRYTEVDEEAIPSGRLVFVKGTAMDLRQPTSIGKGLNHLKGAGYDHNYCLKSSPSRHPELAARVVEPHSGRMVECRTTEPGLQFYTGNYLSNISGKKGIVYNRQDGFCLEAQHWPDSPNHPEFPTTELNFGEVYTQVTEYAFGLRA